MPKPQPVTQDPLSVSEPVRRRLMIALYILVAYLYWVSLYLYVPTLPTYVQSKLNNLVLVGVVLSMYGLWQAIIRLPVGIAADWAGRRKPFIVSGLTLIGLGTWLLAVSSGPIGLTTGRAVVGLGASGWVPLVVAFSSLYAPHEAVKATALLTLVSTVGRGSATAVTGWLNQLGGYTLPFFGAIGAAAAAILFLLPIREKQHPPQKPSVREVRQLITRRDVLLPALLSVLIFYVDYTTTLGFVPILAQQLGGSGVTQSMLVSMNIGVSFLGNLNVTLIVDRIGPRRLIYLSFGLLASGTGLSAMAPSIPVLFAAQFLIGYGFGIAFPALMGLSIRYVADRERTTAMGLHQAVYAIGMFSGPWVSGILANAIGIQPMFMLTAVVIFALGTYGASKLAHQ